MKKTIAMNRFISVDWYHTFVYRLRTCALAMSARIEDNAQFGFRKRKKLWPNRKRKKFERKEELSRSHTFEWTRVRWWIKVTDSRFHPWRQTPPMTSDGVVLVQIQTIKIRSKSERRLSAIPGRCPLIVAQRHIILRQWNGVIYCGWWSEIYLHSAESLKLGSEFVNLC